jgi:hypothetical protein
MSETTDVTSDLDQIAYKASTSQWSSQTDPRDFRILATVIRRIGLNGCHSLKTTTDLPSLAEDAGLAYCTSIREALDSLAAGGWISWKIGKASIIPEERIPSTITLLPVTVNCPRHFGWRHLPDPTLELLYESRNAGNHGYLIVSALKADNQASYKTAQIAKLTGLKVRAVQRAMPKLGYGFRKGKAVWLVDDLDSLSVHGAFASADTDERTARLALRRDRGLKVDQTEQPTAEQQRAEQMTEETKKKLIEYPLTDFLAEYRPATTESEPMEKPAEKFKMLNYDNDTPTNVGVASQPTGGGTEATEPVKTPVAPQAVSKPVRGAIDWNAPPSDDTSIPEILRL